MLKSLSQFILSAWSPYVITTQPPCTGACWLYWGMTGAWTSIPPLPRTALTGGLSKPCFTTGGLGVGAVGINPINKDGKINITLVTLCGVTKCKQVHCPSNKSFWTFSKLAPTTTETLLLQNKYFATETFPKFVLYYKTKQKNTKSCV